MSYVSPRLEAAAASVRTEAEVRALALELHRAREAYMAHSCRNVANLTEDQRVDLIIEEAAVSARLGAARIAFDRSMAAK